MLCKAVESVRTTCEQEDTPVQTANPTLSLVDLKGFHAVCNMHKAIFCSLLVSTPPCHA